MPPQNNNNQQSFTPQEARGNEFNHSSAMGFGSNQNVNYAEPSQNNKIGENFRNIPPPSYNEPRNDAFFQPNQPVSNMHPLQNSHIGQSTPVFDSRDQSN